MIGNRKKLIKRWIHSVEEDYQTMLNLFSSGRNLWALFMGHLVVEKLFKIYYMQITGKDAPRIHSLERLAELVQIKVNIREAKELVTLTTFNIRARYPDYKQKIHRSATKSYTIKQIEVIKKWHERLLQLISKTSDPS